MKKGVKSISGNTEIKVNEWQNYTVAEWYSDTPMEERIISNVKWAVYFLDNGIPNKILEKSEGRFRFQEPSVGKKYLIVAYLHQPELSTGIEVTIISATQKEITSIRATGRSSTLSYGDTLNVVVQTSGMQNDYLELSLYEDDAAGNGHNSINNKNLLKSKTVQVGSQGVATTQFLLEPDFQRIANAYLARGDNDEGSTHEFYVAAYYLGSLKATSTNVNVANPENVVVRREETTQVINGNQSQAAGKVNNVQLTRNGAKKLLVTVNSTGLVGKVIRLKIKEEDYLSNDLLVDQNFTVRSDNYRIDIFLDRIPQSTGGSYWSEGDFQELFADVEVIDTQAHILSETIDVDISSFKVEVADNRTVTVIDNEESLLAAYFAKKEYVEQTTEDAGTYEYTFGGTKANNRTSTAAEKEAVATVILGKVTEQLKPEKRYTTKEAIVEALTADEYGIDTESNKKVSFNTFKLGPKFIRINSAPLEEKVYLVAETGSLNGKTVTIKIKEKDGIIKGTADAILPVLEITEQQMDVEATSAEVQGTEKTEFTATVTNGIAKVPIHLRPKSNEDLEKWKEKITKGKEDGNYTYTFGNENGTVITAENKARIAGIILENAKGGKLGNPKIAEGKTAYKEDVEKVLEEKTYSKGDTITFTTYIKTTEMLWLDVSCSGAKRQHQKNFLKEEGSYFVIGKKCECEEKVRAFMRVLRVAEGTGEYFKGTKTARDPQLGYTTWFSGSGNNFTLSDDHPRTINCNSTNTLCSSAAGAYQIMSWKYDELNGYKIESYNGTYKKTIPEVYTESTDKAKKYDAKGFSQISQDRLCVIILKDIGTITKLLNNDIEGAISNSSGTWVSLPGATAGQPTAKMQETLDYYDEFLKDELSSNSHLHIKSGFLKDFDIICNCTENNLETNEFGLVQVTKLGNPYIINSGIEDSYSYTKKDGTTSPVGQHGDDWMLPEKAQAFSDAVYKLVAEYPSQKIYLGDCSAYNPSKNLGHSATGAHSNGNAFDCRFLKSDGSGSNDINNLTDDEVKLNGRFIEILKESGLFSTFYTDNGKIPGSVHSSGHADHIHGN